MVAAEPMTGIDITAADMLVDLDNELSKAGIQFIFTELKDPVRDKIKRYGLSSRFDNSHFYPTLNEAVDAYLKESGVAWEDWENKDQTR